MSDSQEAGKKETLRKLALAAVLMFGFGFALSPIYDVFCALTGLNGKTQRIEAADELEQNYDPNRLVTLQFDSSVNSHLSWNVSPEHRSMEVHPGKLYEAFFTAENLDTEITVGQAVPSVAPGEAGLYFNKTECFCFTQQQLGGKESKKMPLRFIIDPELPEDITTLTLSYTFFPGIKSEQVTTSQGEKLKRSEG